MKEKVVFFNFITHTGVSLIHSKMLFINVNISNDNNTHNHLGRESSTLVSKKNTYFKN